MQPIKSNIDKSKIYVARTERLRDHVSALGVAIPALSLVVIGTAVAGDWHMAYASLLILWTLVAIQTVLSLRAIWLSRRANRLLDSAFDDDSASKESDL